MVKKLIVGNWKMNPSSLVEAKLITAKIRKVIPKLKQTEVVACPPVVFIQACLKNTGDLLHWGAQSVSYEEGGAHTGEISTLMLSDLGIEYVIAGHSEERAKGETDADVAKKVTAILGDDMRPIVCVGEKVRDENGQYLETLKEQIKNCFADVPLNKANKIVIAYEPVWAIGAQEAMSPEQIYETSLFVKKVFADIFGQESAMKVKILYGGSVNFRNAADIVKIGKVDGLLVGRESVNVSGFNELLKAVDNV